VFVFGSVIFGIGILCAFSSIVLARRKA